MRSVAILGLLLLLVLAWTLWRRDDAAPNVPLDTPRGITATGEPASVGAPTGEAATAASAEATAPRIEAPPLPVSDTAGPDAVLRGRCVDEQGSPIAGVDVRLTSRRILTPQAEAWLVDNDEPEPIDLAHTSGADGVFEFRC